MKKYYQRIEFDENDFKQMTIGPEVVHDVTIQTFPFMHGPMTITTGRDGYLISEGEEQLGLLTEEKPVFIPRKGRILSFI